MTIWNPWHGCHKISPGCQNCYVYRRDESVGKDASVISKTNDYNLPLKKGRNKEYKLKPEDGIVYTCMTSDFFIEEADEWRNECWKMMRERSELRFAIITKRIHRFMDCIPSDWGEGYPNVEVYCTVENQQMADYRLPIYITLPILHKHICHEPMLGPINIEQYLESGQIEHVLCGGESGNNARPCYYEWILSIREQCIRHSVSFSFKQTGSVFVMGGKTYRIERKLQMSQAKKANICYIGNSPKYGDQGALKRDSMHGKWMRQDLFKRIEASKFRSRFKLSEADKKYIENKGMDLIRKHAGEFVSKRLAPAYIPNDGRQTPMHGHPIFLAQHGCACCCRGCLEKWHGIPAGIELTEKQQTYIIDVLMKWIEKQVELLDRSLSD